MARGDHEGDHRDEGPDGERDEGRDRCDPRRREVVRIEPQLFADEGIQRGRGPEHDALGELLGGTRLDALGPVDHRQLSRFFLGEKRELLLLDRDLAFVQLALGTHRHPFPGGHRERSCKQARDAGQQHHARAAARAAGDAHDER